MVANATEMALNPAHGYSQKPPSGRWGPDYDCSSFVYEVANMAGYPVGRGGQDMTRWTGTMAKDFTDAGFQLLPFANVGIDGLEIGDILLNLAVHAEVYLGDGKVAGAEASEDGGFQGKAGDQTGTEITIQPVYTHSHGWNYVLRPPVEPQGDEDGPEERRPPMNMPTFGAQQPGYQGYQGNQQYNGYAQGYQQPGMQGQMPGFRQGQPYYQQNGMQGYQQNGMQGYQQRMPMQGQMMPMQNGMQGQMPMQMGYQGQMPMYGQQGGQQGIKTVMSVDEVANAQQAPGTLDAYFDVHNDILYLKTVSADGIPSICPCEFHEIEEPMPQHGGNLIGRLMGNTSGQQVSREEFEQLKEMMAGGQSYMGQQPNGEPQQADGQQNGQQSNSRRNNRS